MAELKVFDPKTGESSSNMKGNDQIFKAALRLDLLNEYVIMQRRAARSGTACTLTRAQVSGTGKKPFRQKGTGNARQGTLRGPHQYHGGVAWGPKPREYYADMNKKVKKEAIRVALSQKNFESKIGIVDAFEILSGKTKDAVSQLKKFEAKSVLLVGDFSDSTLRAIENIPGVKALKVVALNVKDVLAHDWLLLTKGAFEWCETNLSVKAKVKKIEKKEKAA